MSGKLPPGWGEAEIGALCSLINGRAFKPTDWTPEGTPIVRIQNLNNPNAPMNRFSGEVAEKFLIDEGELLFAWSGTPGTSFGAHVWRRGPAILNQHIFRVLWDSRLVERDFFRLAINEKLDELIRQAHGGAGLQHVTKGKFEATRVSVPPLNEQRRIVEKVDALFAHSKKAKESLDRIPALLEKLKRSILAAAFRGDLTKDWRAQNPDVEPASVLLERIRRKAKETERRTGGRNVEQVSSIPGKYALAVNLPERAAPPGWQWAKLVDIARLESGHTPSRKHPEYWDGDIPWIGIKDAREHHGGVIHDTSQHCTQAGLENSAARLLPAGTVCVSRTASVGYVVLMGRPMATSQDFVNWVCTEALIPEFLMYLFMAEGEDGLRDFGKGTTHTTIYYPEVKAFHVAIPGIEEQREVVRRIEAAFAQLEHLRRAWEAANRRAQKLEQAILAKAFRGELVPQDPNDERAEVLLERIRKEREAEASQAKKSRTKRPAKVAPADRGAAKTAARAEAVIADTLDLVVAALVDQGRLTSAKAQELTGLSASELRPVLKSLVEAGKVRVKGKARGTAYEWIG